LLRRNTNLVLIIQGDITMHRALVSTIFAGLIAFVASAHAHPKTTTQIIKPEAAMQVTLQRATETVKVKASETVKVRAPRELPATVTQDSAPTAESAWGQYGTLLATLVVMCAIAVRRQRMGRS
jgi:hypothetical protein